MSQLQVQDAKSVKPQGWYCTAKEMVCTSARQAMVSPANPESKLSRLKTILTFPLNFIVNFYDTAVNLFWVKMMEMSVLCWPMWQAKVQPKSPKFRWLAKISTTSRYVNAKARLNGQLEELPGRYRVAVVTWDLPQFDVAVKWKGPATADSTMEVEVKKDAKVVFSQS